MQHRKRDWFRILRDLQAAGCSYHAVARKCGRNPTTVQAWAEGVDPKELDARIVLALYAKHCPDKYQAHAREFAICVELEMLDEQIERRRVGFAEVG